MSENAVELSDQDKVDLIQMGVDPETGEPPTFHPILRIWREVLAPAAAERDAKITPAWANRIVSSFQGIGYADVPAFQDRYFDHLLELAKILDDEIEGDVECLKYTTPEEDVEHNSAHYKNLLLQWQLAVLEWELEWTTTDPHAAPELAAISEVHKMFFGPTGITAFLDNISFVFSDDDQAVLGEALEELRDNYRE